MCKSWLLCVLLGALAWGQAPSAAPPPSSQLPAGHLNTQGPPAEKDTSASVPDSAPVLTIDGVCEPQARTAAAKGTAAKPATTAAKPTSTACKTVITKAQFEALANNLAPNITPQMKKQLAGALPRLMAMSNEAKKEGLENTPQFKERLKFYRMNILAQQLQQKLQEQAADIPEADAEKYYKDHSKDFEQYSLERLFIPRMKQVQPAAKEEPEKGAKAGEPDSKDKEATQEEGEKAMSKLAEDLRARAAAGEEFLKLQKEAFEAAGMKIESPTVSLPNVRRTTLPPAHAAIFDLKPGEVSQVISDTGGHYIYKLTSKSEIPLDQAKSEVHTRLQNERIKDKMDKVNNSFKVETNEAYFGPGGASPMSPRPTRQGPAGASAGPQNQPSAQNQTAKPQ
jgi:hypothetical protein